MSGLPAAHVVDADDCGARRGAPAPGERGCLRSGGAEVATRPGMLLGGDARGEGLQVSSTVIVAPEAAFAPEYRVGAIEVPPQGDRQLAKTGQIICSRQAVDRRLPPSGGAR